MKHDAIGSSSAGSFVGAPFPDPLTADQAISRLLGAGYLRSEISVVADRAACDLQFDEFGDDAGIDVVGGAVAGGTIGAILGAAIVIGGSVVAGPISVLVGAAAGIGGGAVAAALLAAGMPSHDAMRCEEDVSSGMILVGVHAHAGDIENVRAALEQTPIRNL